MEIESIIEKTKNLSLERSNDFQTKRNKENFIGGYTLPLSSNKKKNQNIIRQGGKI